MKISKHQLAKGQRTITFTIGAVADTALISDGTTVAHAPVEAARAFYRSLLDKGWADPGEAERIEREMHAMEAAGDRAQTQREERAKLRARTRKERMANAVRGAQ